MNRAIWIWILGLMTVGFVVSEAAAMGPYIPGPPVIPMDAPMYEKKNVPVPTFKMDVEFKLIFGG